MKAELTSSLTEDELRALYAELEKPGGIIEASKLLEPVVGWQPIASAPTDGTPVLLYAPGMTSWNRKPGMPDIVVGKAEPFNRGIAWFCDVGDVDQGYESTGAHFEFEIIHPTFWMPLPAPPKETAR